VLLSSDGACFINRLKKKKCKGKGESGAGNVIRKR